MAFKQTAGMIVLTDPMKQLICAKVSDSFTFKNQEHVVELLTYTLQIFHVVRTHSSVATSDAFESQRCATVSATVVPTMIPMKVPLHVHSTTNVLLNNSNAKVISIAFPSNTDAMTSQTVSISRLCCILNFRFLDHESLLVQVMTLQTKSIARMWQSVASVHVVKFVWKKNPATTIAVVPMAIQKGQKRMIRVHRLRNRCY